MRTPTMLSFSQFMLEGRYVQFGSDYGLALYAIVRAKGVVPCRRGLRSQPLNNWMLRLLRSCFFAVPSFTHLLLVVLALPNDCCAASQFQFPVTASKNLVE